MMMELLKTTDAPVAAFSEYGLVIRAPDIVPLSPAIQEELTSTLEKRYEAFRSIPNFGQGETTLEIYLKKKR